MTRPNCDPVVIPVPDGCPVTPDVSAYLRLDGIGDVEYLLNALRHFAITRADAMKRRAMRLEFTRDLPGSRDAYAQARRLAEERGHLEDRLEHLKEKMVGPPFRA